MADEAKAPAVTDTVMADDDATQPSAASADSAGAGEKQVNGGDAAASEASNKEPEASPPKADETSAVENDSSEKVAAVTDSANTANSESTPAKRKSSTSVPEHKKKTPGKKKKEPELRLNVKPGELYMVSMRGYPPWPVIICDDDMLPDTLQAKRPVSAMRLDGTYRQDFADGGKHVKDRRYPIMFLGTNEFAWELNTALQPVDMAAIKEEVAAGNIGKKKKTKALWEAYEVAAEGHDLAYFKEMLDSHEKGMIQDAEEKEAAAAAKAEAKEKKKKNRKSSAAVDEMDVDVDNAEAPSSKAKPSKKRKKEAEEGDAENEKPVKTPKTLKLTNKPKGASAAKASSSEPKSAKKTKAKSETASETAKPEEKPMTEAERREKQEKSVLYLRHRLQKGFLARDHPPLENEMGVMSDYMKQLEEIENLEAEAIKKTKVHKVLKAIVKLASIPKEEEYNFKKRSTDLLQRWSGALQAEGDSLDASTLNASTTKTNGVAGEEKKDGEAKTEEKKEAENKENGETPEKTPSAAEATKATDTDGDVPMADAKDDKPEAAAAPAEAAGEDAAKAVAEEAAAEA